MKSITNLSRYKSLMVKSNYIIEASYKLNLQEQKIIYLLTTKIEKSDTDFKPYKFTQNELNKLLGKNLTLNELCQCIDSLRNKELTIIKDESLLKTKWLSSSEYFKNGVIELEFSPKLKPYLIQLKERFTKLSLSQMICFDSQYSCRIYELLKQYENVGERIVSIKLLRNMFLIKPEQYKRYNDFKRKVILQAYKEINKTSDISFEFEEIKTGRKVTSIKFYIHSKNKAINEITMAYEQENNIEKVQDIIIENISELEAKKILDAANGDLEKIKEKYSMASDVNNIKNIVAWLIKAIKEDWKGKKSKNKKGTFNNFKGRNYSKQDLDNLEKGLLGY